MTDYKCGHSQDLLILDDNPLSIIAYIDWKDSVGREGTKELCFNCYLKKINAKGKLFQVLTKKDIYTLLYEAKAEYALIKVQKYDLLHTQGISLEESIDKWFTDWFGSPNSGEKVEVI